MLGSYFGEEAQADGFGPDGNFSAPSVAAPTGTATPLDGGWLVKGKWGYACGAPYATHFLPSVLISENPGASRAPESRCSARAMENARRLGRDPRHARQRLELDRGRRRARSEEPRRFRSTCSTPISRMELPASRLHGNPMYAGRCLSFFHAELVAILVGLGYATIDEYETPHSHEDHALSADHAALPASRLSALRRPRARDDGRGRSGWC